MHLNLSNKRGQIIIMISPTQVFRLSPVHLFLFARFLTGLPNMGENLCPPQAPIPVLYQRLPDSTYQRIFAVVYRALRLSVCLFIDCERCFLPLSQCPPRPHFFIFMVVVFLCHLSARHELDKQFFQSFDSTYGSILTNLSSSLEADFTSK